MAVREAVITLSGTSAQEEELEVIPHPRRARKHQQRSVQRMPASQEKSQVLCESYQIQEDSQGNYY